MRNGRSAFVLDKLFSTIDGKKGSCIFENQLRGCKNQFTIKNKKYERLAQLISRTSKIRGEFPQLFFCI